MWLLPCPATVSSHAPSVAEKGSFPCLQLTERILPHFHAFRTIEVNPHPATLLHAHPPQTWLYLPIPAQEWDLLPPFHARCRARGTLQPFTLAETGFGYPPPFPQKPLSAMSCFCIPDTYGCSCQLRWRSAPGCSFQAVKIDPCGLLSPQVLPRRWSHSFISCVCCARSRETNPTASHLQDHLSAAGGQRNGCYQKLPEEMKG